MVDSLRAERDELARELDFVRTKLQQYVTQIQSTQAETDILQRKIAALQKRNKRQRQELSDITNSSKRYQLSDN